MPEEQSVRTQSLLTLSYTSGLGGVLGNLLAEPLFRLFRITEPIAKGVALGTAAHAIGTAKAMELGEVEGAMGSLSIAVAGILTVCLSPVFAAIL